MMQHLVCHAYGGCKGNPLVCTSCRYVFVLSHKFMSRRAKVAAASEATGAAAAN